VEHEFSKILGTFSKIDHILGYREYLTKYKKIDKVSCILLDHSGIKLDTHSKKNYRNYKKN
jgi:hypothetical protein